MANHFDIAIIGAGPAGTACALALRNSGLKIALLDKQSFPRNKTCGDAIPGPSLKYLKKVLPESEREFEQFELKQKLNSSIIYLNATRSIEINWKTKAYNSSRNSFDNFLLDLVKKYTATSILENHSVVNIKEEKNSLLVQCKEQELSCSMVIACDGANSIVSKTLNEALFSQSKGVALRAYYKNVGVSKAANEFYTLKNFQGYFWIFPIENDLYNVGIGISGELADKAFDLKAAFADAIANHPVIHSKMKDSEAVSKLIGFKLPMGGTHLPISGNRFMLCGDAAFLVDPLQGHGIDKAIFSGKLAAEQALKSFKNNDFSGPFMLNYDKAVQATFGKELKRNQNIVKLLTRYPWLLRLLYPLSKLNIDLLLKFYYKTIKAKANS